METIKKILEDSKPIDNKFENIDENNIGDIEFVFNVPKEHPRHSKISNYKIAQWKFDEILEKNLKEFSFLIDENVGKIPFIKEFLNSQNWEYHFLKSEEWITKTTSFLDNFIEQNLHSENFKSLVVIWWGLLTNCGAYIAEKLQKNLILIPTTVLSMADNSWWKVRINNIEWWNFYKHHYKSFYEPNQIIIDKRFLQNLSQNDKKIWLAEIIKHGLFQSEKLYEYLLHNADKILNDDNYLLKAILRTIDLKRICIENDVDETENWSKTILRAWHDISDKIEEKMEFSIPHWYAVSIGIYEEITKENNPEFLEKVKKILDLFGLPKLLEEIKQ